MQSSFQPAIDRALARWIVGDDDGLTALRSVFAVLAEAHVSCGVVRADERDAVVVADPSRRVSRLLVRLAELSSSNRRLLTPSDAEWKQLFGATGRSAHQGAAERDAAWAVCEPLVDADSVKTGSVLVVIGWSEENRDDVLVTLPRLARACANLLASEHVAARASQITHTLNNLLTSVIANVEYASHMLAGGANEPSPLAGAPPELRADIEKAMEHAYQAAKLMTAEVKRISDLGKRGET